FSAGSYLVKDYLARSLVPFTWHDLSDDPEAHALARDLNLPNPAPTTVLFDDGRALYDPTIAELASALGLTQAASRDTYAPVLIATGMTWRRLDAPGADELVNAGVYYGASAADAKAAAGEDVVVVGSGDAAAVAALRFAEHARSVTMVVREPSLDAAALSERF